MGNENATGKTLGAIIHNSRGIIIGICAQFLFFCIGGLVGIFIDVDHIVALIIKGIEITWDNLRANGCRCSHVPGIWVVLCIYCLVCASYFGWIASLVIRQQKRKI